MQYFSIDKFRNPLLLLARVLLSLLFILFGWKKMTAIPATMAAMVHLSVPYPEMAAMIAIIVELFGGLALLLGFFTRPLALIFAVYTLATGILGHPFWHMDEMVAYQASINFYKNVSIVGGFLLLALTGPGKFSLDKC